MEETERPGLRPAVDWRQDGLEIIDQTRLPAAFEIRRLATVDAVRQAIATLAVRGAPAIGVTAAFGLVVWRLTRAQRETLAQPGTSWGSEPRAGCLPAHCGRSALGPGPGAKAGRWGNDRSQIRKRALEAALEIQAEDREACRRIGELGREELAGARRLLTHCNTGRLATAGWGTALGIVYAKAAAGDPVEVLHQRPGRFSRVRG